MSEDALQDIQRSLNAIRNTVSAEDARTQMAALQLLLSASESIVIFPAGSGHLSKLVDWR